MSRPKAVIHPVALLATKDQGGAYHFRPESDLWNEAKRTSSSTRTSTR